MPCCASSALARSSTSPSRSSTCRSKLRYSAIWTSAPSASCSASLRTIAHRACGASGRVSASKAGVPATTPRRWPSRFKALAERSVSRRTISVSSRSRSTSCSATRVNPSMPGNGGGVTAATIGVIGSRNRASASASASSMRSLKWPANACSCPRCASRSACCCGLRAWSASCSRVCSSASTVRISGAVRAWWHRPINAPSSSRTRGGRSAAARRAVSALEREKTADIGEGVRIPAYRTWNLPCRPVTALL
ncbi:hypothetical protein D3C73_897600 [compost metagenome]